MSNGGLRRAPPLGSLGRRKRGYQLYLMVTSRFVSLPRSWSGTPGWNTQVTVAPSTQGRQAQMPAGPACFLPRASAHEGVAQLRCLLDICRCQLGVTLGAGGARLGGGKRLDRRALHSGEGVLVPSPHHRLAAPGLGSTPPGPRCNPRRGPQLRSQGLVCILQRWTLSPR